MDLDDLVGDHLERGEPTGWFEPLYAAAIPRSPRVPWARGAPHPAVVDWLDDPPVRLPGSRVAVVGCGLGDDAAHLAVRGFAVTAIDVAPTALRWAARRFRTAPVNWRRGDVLAPDDDLRGAFDLVVEVHTVPWLPGVVRDAAMSGVAGLVAPGGAALVVTELATSAEAGSSLTGPPWPQAPSELATYRAAGLTRLTLEHAEAGAAASIEVRTTWQRPVA